MPGPGPHTIYTLGTGVGLLRLTRGRFSPQHCLFYSLNAFLGPDLGPFAEWITASVLRLGLGFGSLAMALIHHPFYYLLLLGLPLSFFYSSLSNFLLRKGFLDTLSGAPLSRRQCLLLLAAGSLSHFFLDHLFEENGHSSMYTWILSTGWWKGRAPINPDAVIVIGLLCTLLLGGFIYINSVVAVFRPQAEQLLSSSGLSAVDLLDKAAGYTDIKKRSLLLSMENYVTILLQAGKPIYSPSMKRFLSEEKVEGITSLSITKDGRGAMFDVPADDLSLFVEE